MAAEAVMGIEDNTHSDVYSFTSHHITSHDSSFTDDTFYGSGDDDGVYVYTSLFVCMPSERDIFSVCGTVYYYVR